jgi:nuclear pore complex protein Nup107
MLPLELASISEPEERATEYLHYRQFFIIWDTLERVVECQALETPQMNRNTRAAWLEDYRVRHFNLRLSWLTPKNVVSGGPSPRSDHQTSDLGVACQ